MRCHRNSSATPESLKCVLNAKSRRKRPRRDSHFVNRGPLWSTEEGIPNISVPEVPDNLNADACPVIYLLKIQF